jgi:DNA-binding phage protein
MRHLDVEDVISLLRSEVKRAGGQSPWGRKNGINRTTLNKVLNGLRPPTPSIIKALKLRIVFVSEPPNSQPGLLKNSRDEDTAERQGG